MKTITLPSLMFYLTLSIIFHSKYDTFITAASAALTKRGSFIRLKDYSYSWTNFYSNTTHEIPDFVAWSHLLDTKKKRQEMKWKFRIIDEQQRQQYDQNKKVIIITDSENDLTSLNESSSDGNIIEYDFDPKEYESVVILVSTPRQIMLLFPYTTNE